MSYISAQVLPLDLLLERTELSELEPLKVRPHLHNLCREGGGGGEIYEIPKSEVKQKSKERGRNPPSPLRRAC